jgi:hypothetical protein
MLNALVLPFLRLHACAHRRIREERNCFNARPIYWLCVVQSVVICRGSSPVAFARTDHSGRPKNATPRADSHCPTPPPPLARLQLRRDGLCVLARTI